MKNDGASVAAGAAASTGDSLAAAIRAIAGKGSRAVVELATAGDDQITAFAARVSLSVAMLWHIAEVIEKHSEGFRRQEFLRQWDDVLKGCEDVYERSSSAVKRAEKSEVGELKSKDAMNGRLVRLLGLGAGASEEDMMLHVNADGCVNKTLLLERVVRATSLCLEARRGVLGNEQSYEDDMSERNVADLLTALSDQEMLHSIPEDPLVNGDFTALPTSTTVRPRTAPSITSTAPPSTPALEPTYIFEPYYIVPRTIAPNSPKGTVHAIRPPPDEYMILSGDTIATTCTTSTHRQSRDRNIRHALRRARRISSSKVSFLDTASFPMQVHDCIEKLIKVRSAHSLGDEWKLVDGVELKYVKATHSMFRLRSSQPKTAYLIVIRGILQPDGGVGKQRSRSASDAPPSREHAKSPRRRRHRTGHSVDATVELERPPRPRTKEGSPTPSSGRSEKGGISSSAARRAPNKSSLRKAGPVYIDEDETPRTHAERNKHVELVVTPLEKSRRRQPHRTDSESLRDQFKAQRAGPSDEEEVQAGSAGGGVEDEARQQMRRFMSSFARV